MAITANVIPIRLFLNGATEKELVAVVFIGATVAGRVACRIPIAKDRLSFWSSRARRSVSAVWLLRLYFCFVFINYPDIPAVWV